MKDPKKKIAAIAAVLHYIKTQEESLAMLQEQVQKSADSAKEASALQSSINVWGLGGRQQQMQLRTMMQLKVFHGSKRM
jgi:hypothetical protein